MGNQALNRGIAAYQKVVSSKDSPSGAETHGRQPAVPPPARPVRGETSAAKAASAIENFIKKEKQREEEDKNTNEAQRFLREALGREKGDALYNEVPKASQPVFGFLEDFTPQQLGLFFRSESPAAEALVLSMLPSKLTAQVLADASPEKKTELALRIARMGEVSPEVLERAAAALREKARSFSLSESEEAAEIDGMGALTAILKAANVSFGDRLLDDLERDDPGLGRSIKENLYTLHDAGIIPDRVLEEKLREMSDHDVILLLKYPLEEFRQKVIANLPEGREARLKEEADFLGAVAKVEVDAVARDFLAWFRKKGPWITEEL